MAVTPEQTFDTAATLLNDEGVRWIDTELLGYYNDGLEVVAGLRPTAFAAVVSHALTTGNSRQGPVANARGIFSVFRDGSGPGMRRVNMRAMQAYASWPAIQNAGTPTDYALDEAESDHFWVAPRPSSSASVSVRIARAPEHIAATDANLLHMQERYQHVLLDYVLHRAFAKDDDTGSASRSATYYREFMQKLDGVSVGDMDARDLETRMGRSRLLNRTAGGLGEGQA